VSAKRRWSVVFERTVRELQGVPCVGLEDHPEPKKQIACSLHHRLEVDANRSGLEGCHKRSLSQLTFSQQARSKAFSRKIPDLRC